MLLVVKPEILIARTLALAAAEVVLAAATGKSNGMWLANIAAKMRTRTVTTDVWDATRKMYVQQTKVYGLLPKLRRMWIALAGATRTAAAATWSFTLALLASPITWI